MSKAPMRFDFSYYYYNKAGDHVWLRPAEGTLETRHAPACAIHLVQGKNIQSVRMVVGIEGLRRILDILGNLSTSAERIDGLSNGYMELSLGSSPSVCIVQLSDMAHDTALSASFGMDVVGQLSQSIQTIVTYSSTPKSPQQ
ncbi:MAG: hypothetical protein AAFS10_10115 [Myxococcota bacterium]